MDIAKQYKKQAVVDFLAIWPLCPPYVRAVLVAVAGRQLAPLAAAVRALPPQEELGQRWQAECGAARALLARLEAEQQHADRIAQAMEAGHLPALRTAIAAAAAALREAGPAPQGSAARGESSLFSTIQLLSLLVEFINEVFLELLQTPSSKRRQPSRPRQG